MQGWKLYHAWISNATGAATPMLNQCAIRGGLAVALASAKNGMKVFPVFRAWSLANGYADGLSLDRIDNDGNYEAGNCQWVTRSVNSKRCRALYNFVPIKTKFEAGITEWL